VNVLAFSTDRLAFGLCYPAPDCRISDWRGSVRS
jgi:hypothetical protein